MGTKKTRLLFVFMGMLVLLPLLQQLTGMVKVKPLFGAITESQKPLFDFSRWMEGDYQKEMESYLNEKFGFRNYFIRLNNQVAYSLYRKAKANGVIIGKENYLYELSYINAYYGRDFVGKDSIDHVLAKVQFLTTALKKKNIDLILVFNPGKASYYPEFIPDSLRSEKVLLITNTMLKLPKL
ncbi:MAG: hypothetical protein IPP32_04435 [Bacteroidetes bacterium]|nr:hypothetical protein [Bacteroidota bacterium]